MSDIVESHKVIFSPLRMLFLSLIPQEERELLFPNANQKFTRELVTTSVFTKAFWPSLNANMRASLSSDRAWFGIRSLMNGGLLGERVDLFNATHFRQLGDSGGLQIPRSQSREYFSSGELTDLIEIQNRYQQWKRRNNRYDELDIVKEAMRHYAGMERTTGGVALLPLNKKWQ